MTSAYRARIRGKGQLTLPPSVRRALHVGEDDELEFVISDDGQVTLHGLTTIAADQRWFWTPEWQAGEREASEEIAKSNLTVYQDTDALFADLNESN